MEQLERKLRALLSTSSNTSSCSQTLSQISCTSCKSHYAHTMQMCNRYGEMVQGLREALNLLQGIMSKSNYTNNSALSRNNQGGCKHIENYTKARVTSFGISSASTPVSFKKDKTLMPVPVTASNQTSRYVHKTVVEATAKEKEFPPTRQSSRLLSRRYSKVSIIVGGIRTHDASEIEESASSTAEKLFGTDRKIFEGKLAELKKYKHKNGHCSVPSICHENPPLGVWCSLMRAGYKAIEIGSGQTHGLDLSRIGQLETAGFKWLPERDGKNNPTRFKPFDERIQELLAFKMKYGHCQVAQTFTDYAPLYRYCCRLRLAYKSYHSGQGPLSGLNAARINQLQDMGFNWTSRKGNDLRMEELIHFKKLNKHTRVPQDYHDNKALGMWCHNLRLGFNAMEQGKCRQTHGLNRGNLKSQLDRIGFEWSMNEIDDVRPEVVDNDNAGHNVLKEEVSFPAERATKESLGNKFDKKLSFNHDCNDIGRSEKEWVDLKTATPIQEPNLLKNSSHQVSNEQHPQSFQSVDVKVAPVMPKRFQCGRVIIEFDSDDSDDSDLE